MKRSEKKRFVPVLEHPDWMVFLDTLNTAIPYVLIEKKLLKTTPETTADLMRMHAIIFSGENLVNEYLNLEGEQQWQQI